MYLCLPNEDDNWRRLCRSIDDPALTGEVRFGTPAGRREYAGALIERLDTALVARGAAEWMDRWTSLGIVASPINNLADLAEDTQAWENDYFLEAYCEEVQRQVKIRGLPVGLSKTPGKVESLGPELGQNTELILADTLGYSWEQIGEFKEQGVIP